MTEVRAAAGEGRWRVEARALCTGDGIVVLLAGGERPHVGAVVLSLPRPSRAVPGRPSCTSTVLPLLGHKDDEVARPLAEGLAVACGQPVVVVAGVHVDRASEEDIARLVENCRAAGEALIHQLAGLPAF
ncbi:MAG: hypothetical protein H5T97_10385, partial [Firmicutes bacterium]|nr:hypothetical protein [Bacillota bacterium]